jgi:hypothetical protein
MFHCDAWKIYLAHVSQSLWVDANARVPWRLAGASAEHLEHLFDMRKLLNFTAGSGHWFHSHTMGTVTHWSPSISYSFLADSGLIRADHWETIQALTEWICAHFFHIAGYMHDLDGPFASQADQWEYIYGYRGPPLVERMIQPLPDRRHITHGCWGTDGFFAAVLRAVNVPVRHGRSTLGGVHSRPEFFTVGRNLAHGDEAYSVWVRPGFNTVPIHRIFYDDAELAAEIDAPPARPGMTVPQTASYNIGRKHAALAVEFKTDYLLGMRCWDVAHAGEGVASHIWTNLRDYYTEAEMATIATDCNTVIAAVPGGCLSIGWS